MQKQELSYWQLASELEEGRNLVLRMVARNEKLELILNTLCEKAQIYNPTMLCSILRLDREQGTLHPIASVSLPDFYCQALEGVAIGAGVGSCGTAAFTKKRVVVENINTHPFWNQYKGLALEAGVQSCWSEPIIGADGIIYGTFAMYYRTPKTPTEDDLKFIELSANLAAVVFENHSNRMRLLEANNLLNKTINERNEELEQVNRALKEALTEQSEKHNSMITNEKMLTTNTLISGFSHEINTPVGIALTAATATEDKLKQLQAAFENKTLTKTGFSSLIAELSELVGMNHRSLLKASQLLNRFKDVNTVEKLEQKSTINMVEFFNDIQCILKPVLGIHELSIDCEPCEFYCSAECLRQVIFNLVENSITHGFTPSQTGIIHINISQRGDEIVINYQDDGCGLDAENEFKVFEPFFTTARNKKHLGLGLSITNSLITHNLDGRIRIIKSPVGVRFEIVLPINNQY